MFELSGKYLGIDIDGCINDIEKFKQSRMYIYAKNLGVTKTKNINGYYLDEVFEGMSKEDALNFWKEHYFELLALEPRPYAKEVISKLRSEGAKIWIISSRNDDITPDNFYGRIYDLTKEYLLRHGIVYDKLSMDVHDKASFCKLNNISCMVEDSPYNITSLAKFGITTLSFFAGHNSNIKGENIYSVNNWLGIYFTLHRIYDVK